MKNDHQTTIRISTLRGPNLSPITPLGISNRAYAEMNPKNTQPICSLLNPSSFEIRGAACDSATRSIYVMIARVTANTTTQ